MNNNNALNLTVLTEMHPCEFEEWRERGENDRHILTSAVAQLLHVPAGWKVNLVCGGQYSAGGCVGRGDGRVHRAADVSGG